MDPITASMLAAGTIGSAGASVWSAQSANAANKKMAREQMAFQERMSNTAYQRQMADMKAAGINPMLALSQGGGANSPSGATAQMQSEYANASSSAMEVARTVAELKNLQETNKKIQSDTKLNEALANSARTTEIGLSADNQRKKLYGQLYGEANSAVDLARSAIRNFKVNEVKKSSDLSKYHVEDRSKWSLPYLINISKVRD